MELQEISKHLPSIEKKPDSDFTHHFKGLGIHKSECSVKIWMKDGFAFILLTDTGKGTSVTNAAEQLIEEIYFSQLQPKGLAKDKCLFVETYDPKEGIDVVIPVWDKNKVIDVDWKHMGKIINSNG